MTIEETYPDAPAWALDILTRLEEIQPKRRPRPAPTVVNDKNGLPMVVRFAPSGGDWCALDDPKATRELRELLDRCQSAAPSAS